MWLRKRRGSTLLEMLLAATCLAAAAIGVLGALRFANDRTITARYRTIALQLVRTNLETAIGQATSGYLAAGTTTQTLTNTGIPATVTVTTTATPVGATDRFSITSQATWTQLTSGGNSVQTVQLYTIARNLGAN
ncbi:MAG: hypothetical protein ACHQ50_04580 [Fimbriimonadales bacterium]